ncbi:PREDICTED: interleukin-13 [Condylura cristata]|uniref:interleukin-13 n=1 Tax=Condylura cristata TaxID=143302 RepID=UPI000334400F|nr:PREDICTED: interleukin-13 [Condylura cristata]
MALGLTVVIALTCLGDLTSPASVPSSKTTKNDHLKELIRELNNITQKQVTLCNGSMVWSVNLTEDHFCAALESLKNVSNCSAIRKTQRMLHTFCPDPEDSRGASALVRDTKIEVIQFLKDLLKHLQKIFRYDRN